MPREFVVQIDHKSLQYLVSQNILNQRHLKWVEYVKTISFLLKHRSRQSKKVADALSRRRIFLIEMKIKVLGFDDLKNLYENDLDFAVPWKSCQNHITNEKNKWVNYLIQEDMLFKGIQFCIPRRSIRVGITLRNPHL